MWERQLERRLCSRFMGARLFGIADGAGSVENTCLLRESFVDGDLPASMTHGITVFYDEEHRIDEIWVRDRVFPAVEDRLADGDPAQLFSWKDYAGTAVRFLEQWTARPVA